MPSATQQRRLVEQHRQAQIANRAGFLAQFLAAWGILDLADLDRSTPNWLRIVLRLIAAFRQDSANLSLQHYRDLRRIGAPDAELDMPDVDFRDSDLDALLRETSRRTRRYVANQGGPSRPGRVTRQPNLRGRANLTINWDRADRATDIALRVTGPINIKSRIARGESPERAKRNALVDASGAAGRQIMNGGRATTLGVVENDKESLGWIRVTDGNPCAFCAMLSSWGITYNKYNKRSFDKSDPRFIGPGEVKVHDHCACVLVPVFREDDARLSRGVEFRAMWDDHIKGQYSGKDALRAWRRLYEQQQRDVKRARAA